MGRSDKTLTLSYFGNAFIIEVSCVKVSHPYDLFSFYTHRFPCIFF